ncbi:MAG: cobalamin-binding protein [Chloroflexi bacterium]|nr:cobalamin-binding protein [Chloroflexota bacterium]
MRICSLLPSATEIVYALGLGGQLVGVSHSCDHPEEAQTKPVVSRSVREITHLSSGEIDGIVQQARANSNPLYWIDGDLLKELQPDLIITQELCEVCAISSGSVFETAAKVLDYQPQILTIRPDRVADILQNVRNIAAAAGVSERGAELAGALQRRIDVVVEGVGDNGPRPRVLCLDWLDPLRNTGQWVPELVGLAGGEEGLAVSGGLSRELTWDEVRVYAPEYLMVMPCAFGPERVRQETSSKLTGLQGWEDLPAVRDGRVFLFDGRIPTRHGPRIVDVLEGLAEALHPERLSGAAPPGVVLEGTV